jgi:hypothetical protein
MPPAAQRSEQCGHTDMPTFAVNAGLNITLAHLLAPQMSWATGGDAAQTIFVEGTLA